MKKKKFSRYIDVQLNEIMKIQMHFQSNYLIFLFKFLVDVEILKEFLKMKFIYFHLEKNEKHNKGQSLVLLYGTNNDVK